MNKTRPSQYLIDKCQALEKVIDFFTQGGGWMKTINEKLCSFLYQIDFWDWEMENLMYSFQSFKERSEAWDYSNGVKEFLVNHHSILIKDNLVDDLKWKRECREYRGGKKVVAPFETLNRVIGKWNGLIDQCEQRVMVAEKHLQAGINLGAQLLPNLDKYRKEFWEDDDQV